jgi:hypothetical protein
MLTPDRLIPSRSAHLMDAYELHHFRCGRIELHQELMGFDFEVFNGGHLSFSPTGQAIAPNMDSFFWS